jgi:UDP-glucose 4-epimerase
VVSPAASSASKALSGTRALVTGASGFLGTHLCRRLLVERAEVHAVSRSPRRPPDRDGLHWWQCDFVDPAAVRDLIGRLEPDVVFHFGGMVTAAPDLALVAPTFHTLLASTVNLLTAVTDVGGGRVVLSAHLRSQRTMRWTGSSPSPRTLPRNWPPALTRGCS